MKNHKTAITFKATVLLSITLKEYLFKILRTKGKTLKLNEISSPDFDTSLRNFHPNKGE